MKKVSRPNKSVGFHSSEKKYQSFKRINSESGVVGRSENRDAKNSAVKATSSKCVRFVRNGERTVKDVSSSVTFLPTVKDTCYVDEEENLPSSENCNTSVHFDVPDLCTSLQIANKLLEEAGKEKRLFFGKTGIENACTSKEVKTKVLKKVNIPFEEQIYKDLVALKVSEDDLFSNHDSRKIRSKQFQRAKDKDPDLSDFYIPLFNQEFVLKSDKLVVEPNNTVYFNGFSIAERMKNWECPE